MSEVPGYVPESEATEINLDREITEAQQEVAGGMTEPVQDVVDRTSQLGFFAAVKDAASPHLTTLKDVAWKDTKASVMLVVSLIPFLGEGYALRKTATEVAKAKGAVDKAKKAADTAMVLTPELLAKEAAATTKFNTAITQSVDVLRKLKNPKRLKIFQEAIERGADATDALRFAEQGAITLSKGEKFKYAVTAKTRHGLKSSALGFLNELNPTPDVPAAVDMAGLGAEMLGIHGAGAVGPAWQIAVDRKPWIQAEIGLVRDVGKVVADRTKRKFAKLREPNVEKAAAAFA